MHRSAEFWRKVNYSTNDSVVARKSAGVGQAQVHMNTAASSSIASAEAEVQATILAASKARKLVEKAIADLDAATSRLSIVKADGPTKRKSTGCEGEATAPKKSRDMGSKKKDKKRDKRNKRSKKSSSDVEFIVSTLKELLLPNSTSTSKNGKRSTPVSPGHHKRIKLENYGT